MRCAVIARKTKDGPQARHLLALAVTTALCHPESSQKRRGCRGCDRSDKTRLSDVTVSAPARLVSLRLKGWTAGCSASECVVFTPDRWTGRVLNRRSPPV